MSTETAKRDISKVGPKEAFGILQNLIGKALGAARNDRDPDQWDNTVGPLEEAHDLCIEIRSRWKP